MKNLYMALLSCLLMQGPLFAKEKVIIDKETKIRPVTAIKIGDRMYAESYYYNAVEMYKQALMVDAKNRYAMYWLAKAYYMSRDYEKAVVFFEKFTQQKPAKPKDEKKWNTQDIKYFSKFDYDYGCAAQMNGQYDVAIERFNKFRKSYEGEDKADMDKLTKSHIEGCEYAKEHDNSLKMRVTPMGMMINNAYTESAPFPIGDSVLYFTSLSFPKLININKWKTVKKARLYKTVKTDGQWQKPVMLPDYINTTGFEVGNSAISPDGQRMYFTKGYHPMEDEVVCNLFVSELKNNRWQEPVAINSPVNDPRYTTTQPTVRTMENGSEMVFFVSDRPGGVGDMDIWYFIRNAKGDIKGPNCLPAPINTVGNEFTPYFDNQKGILYFSSDGHPGYGGFDVFSTSQGVDLTWSKPENVGKPINSQFDDIYYTRIPGAQYNESYLVSNRTGTTALNSENASDDIFFVEDFKFGLNGFVAREDGDGAPLNGSVVKLYLTDVAGNDSLVAVDSTITAEGGYFFKLSPDADYKVVAEKPGFKPKTELVSTKALAMEDTINQDFRIKTGLVATSGKVFKDGDPSVTALTGATLTLYEKDHQNGKDRVVTTFTTSDATPMFNFDLDNTKKYVIAVRRDGYFAKSFPIDPRDFGDVLSARKDLGITMMEKDKAYTLSNIYYEFGKASLTASSEKVLDELKKLLDENPTIVIELSSHTDSKGGDAYNMGLSQKRAESCVNYLISKGVLKQRLVPKGYGETKPLVPNTKPDGMDDEEGRAKNRRTEFKIIGELSDKVKISTGDADGIKK